MANIIVIILNEILETFKKVMDYFQYIFGGVISHPFISAGLLILLLAGRGGKSFKIGNALDIKL
jgi:hypothetical protein